MTNHYGLVFYSIENDHLFVFDFTNTDGYSRLMFNADLDHLILIGWF